MKGFIGMLLLGSLVLNSPGAGNTTVLETESGPAAIYNSPPQDYFTGHQFSTYEQKVEALDFLYSQLSENHVNLYANISQEDYEAAKKDLAVRAANMNDIEFYHALEEFVALARDGHTLITLDHSRISQYSFQKGLPFAIRKFDNEWRLLLSDEANRQYLGLVVTAIEGMPIEEVYNRAASLVSYDTQAWMENSFSSTINFIDTLQYLGIVDNDISVTLTLKDGENLIPAEFYAMTEEEIYQPEAIVRLNVSYPPTVYNGTYYSFEPLDDQILYIQYNTCAENPEYGMVDFTADVAEALAKGNYQKLVVDLRNNSGGNSAVLYPLIELLEETAENYTLYTLIGKDTFSSGMMNAVYLWQTGAILVGTPTGTPVNHYGNLGVGEVPHFPYQFYYSKNYFEMIPDYEGTSLEPELWVEQSYDHYLAGIDDPMEAIRRHQPDVN